MVSETRVFQAAMMKIWWS